MPLSISKGATHNGRADYVRFYVEKREHPFAKNADRPGQTATSELHQVRYFKGRHSDALLTDPLHQGEKMAALAD